MTHRFPCAALVALIFAGGTAPGFAAPSVALSPNVNHPSSTVRVSGSGFGPGKGIDLYWDATDELLAVSDGTGAFANKSIPVPAAALPGTHWVTAVERDSGDAAQAAFTVRTDWVEHGFSEKGRRYNPWENVISPANASSLDVAWTFATGDVVESSPAVANGLVYIGSNDGYLYALDATTGALKWKRNVGGVDYSSPAVANGIVYVGSMAGKIYAFNASTGAIKWRYPASGALVYNVEGSPTVLNGVVYIGADDGNVYALDATTGTKLWSFLTTAGYQMWSAPALSNGTLFVGSGDNNLYAIDTATHAELWASQTGNSVLSSPAIANGWVFFGSYDDYFYAQHDDEQARLNYSTGSQILSSAAFANGNVYFGSADGNLRSLSVVHFNLNLNWAYAIGGGAIYSSPAVANGIVYFATSEFTTCCYITALNAADGSLLWEHLAIGNSLNSSPAVANGMVYIGSDDHKVYAFALNAGANAAYRRDMRPPSFATLHPDYRLKPVR
jgi:outer membrane protein assembly factor BamB